MSYQREDDTKQNLKQTFERYTGVEEVEEDEGKTSAEGFLTADTLLCIICLRRFHFLYGKTGGPDRLNNLPELMKLVKMTE